MKLKTIYDTNGDYELILFNNKEIQIGGKTVFYQDWFDQGVFSICDILDSSGMYLNFAVTYFQVLLNDCWKRRETLLATIQFSLQGISLFTCHRRC